MSTTTPLTPEVIATVKATSPVLAAHGTDITTTFYHIMFSQYPEVRQFFNRRNQVPDEAGQVGAQPRALADAVYAYAANIDNLEALSDAVNRIAHKHASLGIMPEHYPIVGTCLLQAIKEVLGDAATEEIMEAWRVAYGFLADIFIDAEKKIRETNEKKLGGFTGFKPFVVEKKQLESQDVISFVLAPVGGGFVPSFTPGQYLSFRLELPTGEVVHRNYSISDVPQLEGEEQGHKSYRISIKRIDGGKVSSHFHDAIHEGDTIKVGAPCGDFAIDESFITAEVDKLNGSQPLVFISAGIGITPILSMFKSVIARHPHRLVYFIHGTRDGAHHPFASEVRRLAAEHPKTIQTHVCYSQPRPSDDVLGRDYDSQGHVDVNTLYRVLPQPLHMAYYFCGPPSFMMSIRKMLRWLSVPDTRVHFEFFGPFDSSIDSVGRPAMA